MSSKAVSFCTGKSGRSEIVFHALFPLEVCAMRVGEWCDDGEGTYPAGAFMSGTM